MLLFTVQFSLCVFCALRIKKSRDRLRDSHHRCWPGRCIFLSSIFLSYLASLVTMVRRAGLFMAKLLPGIEELARPSHHRGKSHGWTQMNTDTVRLSWTLSFCLMNRSLGSCSPRSFP